MIAVGRRLAGGYATSTVITTELSPSFDSGTWLSASTTKVTVCIPALANVQANWLLPFITVWPAGTPA